MAAITWRQLVGASPADATRPLAYAQQAFDNAFTRLGGVVAEREKLDEQNWATTKENNTQAFLDQLYSQYKTPEALAAARASGELDALQAQYGPQIDRKQVRGAADSRAQALQQQAQQAIAYQNMKLDQEQDPIKQRILAKAYGGDIKGAQAEYAANPNLRNGADLMKAITGEERTRIRFDQDSQRYVWEGEKHTSDLARNAAAIRASDASATASRAAAGTAAEGRNMRYLEQLTKLQEKGLGVDSESVGSSKGFNAVMEAIKNGEADPAKRSELMAAATKIMRDPKNHDLTVTDMAALALSSSGGGWFSKRGGNLDQLVSDLRGTEDFRRGVAQRAAVKDVYTQQAAALQNLIFPKGLPGMPAPAARPAIEEPADAAPGRVDQVANPFLTPAPASVAAPTVAPEVRQRIEARLAQENDFTARQRAALENFEKARRDPELLTLQRKADAAIARGNRIAANNALAEMERLRKQRYGEGIREK